MSKSTFFLLIILFLVIGSFFVFKNYYINRSTLLSNPVIQATPTPESESTLSLMPSSLTVKRGVRSSINVVLDHKGYPPSLVQLEIVYDPNVLTNFQIIPGNLFINPTVLLNSIDDTTGRISYAIEPEINEPSNTNNGVIATIYFLPKANAFQTETSLYFLPKTSVKIQDDIDTLKSQFGSRIFIDQGAIRPASPSGRIKY